MFGDTGFANANADALTFRDENGQPVQYPTAKLPDADVPVVAARRLQLERRRGARRRRFAAAPGIFTGRPAYVWISNQIGNTGVLTGFEVRPDATTPSTGRSTPNPDAYKPTNVTGAPASHYELAP